MRLSLSMVNSADRDGSELRRIVLDAKPCRSEEQLQNLRIRLRGPAGDEEEQKKHENTAGQAVEQIEGARANAHGEKKQLPLRAENSEWPQQRAMHQVDPSWARHTCLFLLRMQKPLRGK